MAGGRSLILLALLLVACSGKSEPEYLLEAKGSTGQVQIFFNPGPLKVGELLKVRIIYTVSKESIIDFPNPEDLKGAFHTVVASRISSLDVGKWTRTYLFDPYLPGKFPGPIIRMAPDIEVPIPEIEVLALTTEKDKDLKPFDPQKEIVNFPWWGIVLIILGALGLLFFLFLVFLKKKPLKITQPSFLQDLESIKPRFHEGGNSEVRAFYRLGRRCWLEVKNWNHQVINLEGYYNFSPNQSLETWYQDFQKRDRTWGFSDEGDPWMIAEEDLDRLLYLYRLNKEEKSV